VAPLLTTPTITGYVSATPRNDAEARPLVAATPWPMLVERLSNIPSTPCTPCAGKNCPSKFTMAWSPTRVEGPRRANEYVQAITLAVLDFDDFPRTALAKLETDLQSFEYLIHSTHGHSRIDEEIIEGKKKTRVFRGYEVQNDEGLCDLHNNFRLVMPVSREITPTEWPTVLATIVRVLEVDAASSYRADPSCKDISRLYFLPTTPVGVRPFTRHHQGISIDVDAMLALATRLPKATPAIVPSPSRSVPVVDVEDEDDDGDEGVSVATVRKAVIAARKRKGASTFDDDIPRFQLLDALVKGEPLADHGRRSTAINRAAAMVAHYVPPDTIWEVVAEFMRPSIAAMDFEPEGLEHWMHVAEQSYERAMPRAKANAAELAVKRAADVAIAEGLLSMMPRPREIDILSETPGPPSTPISFSSIITDYDNGTIVQAEDGTWKTQLIRTADGKLVACPFNVYMMLSHTPSIKGSIRFNTVTKDIEVRGGPFHGKHPDILATLMADWLHKVGKIKISEQEVRARMLVIARENEYDPIAERLNRYEWDGVERLDKFFFDYVKVRTTSFDGAIDLTEHLHRIGKMWFVSAVARALHPGSQVDTMLVMEGMKEGEGKTKFLRLIFGRYYATTHLKLGDKDSQMLPSRYWGVELGELGSLKRSEDEILKGYLTTATDSLRLPYSRTYEDFPRRCIFIGTTNEERWLTPSKGRRRYWPVYVQNIDLDAIERDIDQLWAEAVHRFKAGERWHLTEEERVAADAEAEGRMVETFIEAKIMAHWNSLKAERRPTEITLVQVVEDFLKMSAAERVNQGTLKEISAAMKKMGFTREVRHHALVWVPTRELLGQKAIPAYLRVVSSTTLEESLEDIANAKIRE
jgi:predicted P-loop ATPase